MKAKTIAGTRPSRVPKDQAVPGVADGAPALPDYLSGDHVAAGTWARLAPDLYAKGVLTPWDVDLFAGYCLAVSVHSRAVKEWAADDFATLARNSRGYSSKHPVLQILRDSSAAIASIGREFGLSPQARENLSVKSPPGPTHGGDDRVTRLVGL